MSHFCSFFSYTLPCFLSCEFLFFLSLHRFVTLLVLFFSLLFISPSHSYCLSLLRIFALYFLTNALFITRKALPCLSFLVSVISNSHLPSPGLAHPSYCIFLSLILPITLPHLCPPPWPTPLLQSPRLVPSHVTAPQCQSHL